MEYYAPVKNEITSFATKMVQLKPMMLSEITQFPKDKFHVFPDLW